MDFEIEAIISFRLPLPFEKIDDICAKTYEQIFQVQMLHDFVIFGTYPISVEKIKSKRENNLSRDFFKSHRFAKHKFISLKCHVPDGSKKIKNTDKYKWTKQQKREIFLTDIAHELEFTAYMLTFAANLARPGTMSISDCLIFVNGEFYKTFKGISSELVLLFTHDRKLAWPKIAYYPIADVWNWLYPLNDFKNAFGTTPLGRGLCAFSYFFLQGSRGNTAEPLEDLWALVGLESLYKTNGSRSELKERIRLFLGDHPRLNSLIDSLYKIRSSVIHGGMNMPFSFCPYDATNEIDSFEQKSTRVAESSTALLVATMQKMFKLNIYDIRYEQRLILEQKNIQ
jgi:hypothetical protein